MACMAPVGRPTRMQHGHREHIFSAVSVLKGTLHRPMTRARVCEGVSTGWLGHVVLLTTSILCSVCWCLHEYNSLQIGCYGNQGIAC